jgi:hypothetical protein
MSKVGTNKGVYLAGRDLAGWAAIGTHLFLVIVPGDKKPRTVPYADPNTNPPSYKSAHLLKPQDLGDGTYGFVAGAQNKNGRLMLEYFEKSDYQATREHYNWDKYGGWSADFDTEIHKVETKKTVDVLIRLVFDCLCAYVDNETAEPIPYPSAGWGLNSNSWAQSVVEYSGGTAPGDFFGLDLSGGDRLPKAYFTPHFFGKHLPLLNGKTLSNLAVGGQPI